MVIKRILQMALLFSLSLFPSVVTSAADFFYEDWEKADSSLSGWKIDSRSADVKLAVSGGAWKTYHVKFNTGKYTKAALYLGAYGTPAGRCWIDNIVPEGFTLRNPSFEELSANGWQVGWGLDSPGKWTHLADRASNGKRSVLFFDQAYAAQMIRMTQIVDLKPNTDYSYSFDFYMEDDFYGGIRCSVMAVGVPEYYYMGGMVEDIDMVIADRSSAGLKQCQMSLSNGAAAISREISVPKGQVLEARASCKAKALTGTLAMIALDTSSGNELARVQARSGTDYWQKIGMRFTATGGKIRIKLEADGRGETLLDGIGVSQPILLPPAQNIKWSRASEAYKLPQTLAYAVKGDLTHMIETGVGILSKDLGKAGVKLGQATAKPGLVVTVGKTANTPKGKGDEAYFLGVSKRGVRIEAETEKGAFYGLMTLCQLIYSPPDTKPSVLACRITDWPDLPWRSIFAMQAPEWMARRKFNHAENVDVKRYEEYLKYNIVLIPHENITHFPYKHPMYPPVLQDPNYVEGVGKTDILKLTGETPANLSGLNIMRTRITDIVVTSEDGSITYKEGQDYSVIPGDLELVAGCALKQDGKPFGVARIAGGRIADGQTVLATYEHGDIDSYELCLAEEEPQKAVTDLIVDTVSKYKVPFYAALVSESPAGVGKGPRCVATGLTVSKLIARFYDRINNAVKQVDPKCRLFLWSDDFMPWEHSGRSGMGDVPPLLPKDVVMGNWYYGPAGTVQFNVKTAKLWTEQNLDFTLMGWYDFYNIRSTAAVALWARQHGMPCLGTSSWDYSPSMTSGNSIPAHLDEAAICAWRAARKGESGFVDVEAELAKGME